MKVLIGGLAAALLAAAHGAAAQEQHGASAEQAARPDGADPPIPAPGWAPPGPARVYPGYAYALAWPAPGGYYSPFAGAGLEGDWRQPTHPADCGHWEQGRDAWRYVWIQSACMAPVAGWSLH